MPLKYPSKWKFDGFEYEIPVEAHREFLGLVNAIAEGEDSPKAIYEEFKTAYGETSSSSDFGWAESDLSRAMANARKNAARYVASFYSAIEHLETRGVEVPTATRINKILSDYDVPLMIDGDQLVLASGDIQFTEGNNDKAPSATAFVRGPVIGRGGYGIVYQITRKTKVGEYHYAMKVLDPIVFNTNAERAEARFKREMMALEKLQHRGIVQFLEAGIDHEQKPYILMPFIEGTDLRSALSGAKPSKVLGAFDEILQAIEFAHGQGVVHRDLKPKNILVRLSDGQPIVLDFGCAFLLDEMDHDLTTTAIGTSAYVPEEVLRDPKNRSPSQDVFACGVLLYEVIAGKQPRAEDYEPIEGKIVGYRGIDKLVQAALAPSRKRIATAKEMRAQLSKLRAG